MLTPLLKKYMNTNSRAGVIPNNLEELPCIGAMLNCRKIKRGYTYLSIVYFKCKISV